MENESKPRELLPIPMSDRILVRRDPKVTKIGNIELPGEAQSKPKKGTVIAVGPGRVLEDGTIGAIEVQVGDHVWFSPFAGLNVSEEIEEVAGFVVMRHDDLLLRDLRFSECQIAGVEHTWDGPDIEDSSGKRMLHMNEARCTRCDKPWSEEPVQMAVSSA